MRLSLRSKLFGLVTICVALAAVPLILLAGRDFRANTHRMERDSFAGFATLLEGNISALYFSFLTSTAETVLESREDIYLLARLFKAPWETLPEKKFAPLVDEWSRLLRRLGISLGFFVNGQAVYGDKNGMASLAPERESFKGVPFGEILRSTELSHSSRFALFLLSREEWLRFDPLRDEKTDPPVREVEDVTPLLVGFLPVPEKNGVITLSVELDRLEQQMQAGEKEIIHEISEKFGSLHQYPGAVFLMFNAKGAMLAHRGPESLVAENPATALLRAAAERLQHEPTVEVTLPSGEGDILYRVAWFKPLGWYMAVGVPEAELGAPTAALMRRLAVIALVTSVAGLLCTLGLTAALIRPLRALTARAKALSGADFSSPGAVSRALGGVPGERGEARQEKDEVRQLAQAFAHLGQTLDKKIADLVQTTAAKERMQGELTAARDIQMGMLPPSDKAFGGEAWQARAMLVPAREVGGDLYDVLSMPDGRPAVVIGDVSGKGVPAALFMSMAVTLLRSALRTESNPAVVMTRLNDFLAENNPSCMFLSLFIGVFDPRTGRLEYANGGHCRPLVVDSTGAVRTLMEMSGPLVGPMPGMHYRARTAILLPGETCLLYTDGISEAMNTRQELFGEARLAACLAAAACREAGAPQGGAAASALLEVVYAAVQDHAGDEPQSDDITMLALHYS